MKLTNPVALIAQLYANGAAAVVLFNRMYQPDIDVEKIWSTRAERCSVARGVISPLRWVGIAFVSVDKIDYAVSGGVHQPEDVVKSDIERASCRGGGAVPFI